jgi:glycosyltransferase involved in cell wall biosynthesis
MISIIIPTYNRLEKMKKTLESFCRQTLPQKDFEIIVVDDGGSDGTKEFMEDFQKSTDLNLKYFYLEHRGPGAARNFGVEKATFPLILFCGDDTFPDKKLLEAHIAYHQQKMDVAVLGLALWDESEKVTDYMRWLAPEGPQFHYNTIKNRNDAGFDHFYTCNISLEKKWLESEKFDEKFDCAFEDIDLGLRLEKKGLKIFYEPSAKIFHSHFYNEESFGERMKRVGRSVIIFFRKYENDKNILRILKKKYAPFLFFPGLKTFHWLSKILAKSKLIRKINPKYGWFCEVCRDYSSGMIEASNRQ